jgi:hypothetical protein
MRHAPAGPAGDRGPVAEVGGLALARAAREELPGDVTACVSADLEKRISPVRVVIDRRLPSGTVRRAVEEWRKLRSLDDAEDAEE